MNTRLMKMAVFTTSMPTWWTNEIWRDLRLLIPVRDSVDWLFLISSTASPSGNESTNSFTSDSAWKQDKMSKINSSENLPERKEVYCFFPANLRSKGVLYFNSQFYRIFIFTHISTWNEDQNVENLHRNSNFLCKCSMFIWYGLITEILKFSKCHISNFLS